MNYQTIKSLALSYTDRADEGVIARMDDFLRLTEARINRRIRVGKQTRRATLEVDSTNQYLGLPADFGGLRDIEVHPKGDNSAPVTPQYVSPEQMNNRMFIGFETLVYTIIADQLQLNPTPDGSEAEIVYYSMLPPLSTSQPETWLSIQSPDVYVFGLCIEISGYVKDADAARIWDGRFGEELAKMEAIDQIDRWSGAALQIKLG